MSLSLPIYCCQLNAFLSLAYLLFPLVLNTVKVQWCFPVHPAHIFQVLSNVSYSSSNHGGALNAHGNMYACMYPRACTHTYV